MENNQSLFGWDHSEEASSVAVDAPYMSLPSESSFSVSALCGGGALHPTIEPPAPDQLPPNYSMDDDDPLHMISPIDALLPGAQLDHHHYYYHFGRYPCSEVPPLDDFNFDSFAWDDALLQEPTGDAAAGDLSLTPSAATDPYYYSVSSAAAYSTFDDDISCDVEIMKKEYYYSGGCSRILPDMAWEFGGDDHDDHSAAAATITNMGEGSQSQYYWTPEKKEAPRTSSSSSGATMISFEEVSKYFCMPIVEAAKNMKVGLTVLKKRCRELGISRWPHRKMKSLNSLIRNVQELGKGVATENCIRKEVEKLEEDKRMMETMPEMELSERTKKLRQACFKANFKKRRALQYCYPSCTSAS